MTPFLFLLPMLLGAFCLLPPTGMGRVRPVIGAASAVGIATGFVLFFVRGGLDEWRTTAPEADALAIVGIAVAASWALMWTNQRESGWRAGAMVGVAGSGLLLAASNEWVVPMLLFWVVSSAAIGLAMEAERGRASVWGALFASDATWIAAVILRSLDEESWRFGLELQGDTLVLVVIAVCLRAGVMLRTGIWAALTGPGAPALPLVVGGAFVMLIRSGGAVDPTIAVALAALAVATCVWAAIKPTTDVSAIPAWISALMVSACFVAPNVTARAGIAAVLATATAAVWERTTSGARVWRAAVLGAVPMTATFGVIVAAALAAFERAAAAVETIDAAPWTVIGALLPLAVGLGVVIATRVGRLLEPAVHFGWETIVTCGLFVVSIAVGLLPIASIGVPGGLSGPSGRPFALHMGAVIVAAGVGWLVYRRNEGAPTRHAPHTAVALPLEPPRSVATLVTAVSLLLLLVAAGATAWLTVRGLLVGFL